MLSQHAQFEDGSVSVEAGIADMLVRMESGRFKVFKHLNDWFEEFRLYHRKDGKVVKEGDDLMSATRYGVMMLRYARTDIPHISGAHRDVLLLSRTASVPFAAESIRQAAAAAPRFGAVAVPVEPLPPGATSRRLVSIRTLPVAAADPLARAWSRAHALTDPCQFDILQSGSGWQGTECNSIK